MLGVEDETSAAASTEAHSPRRCWWIARAALDAATIEALREEADCLAAVDPPSFANGCVLEPVAEDGPPLSDAARVEKNAYDACRRRTLTPEIAKALFETLPALLGRVFPERAYLFNEHYVVKPARSEVTFRWHRDSDEQLGGYNSNKEDEDPLYVSCWCALDACDERNGCLEFERSGPARCGSGDVVVFSANELHRSGANESLKPRRAYYAQYSRRPVLTGPRRDVLRLAIPCSSQKSLDQEIDENAVRRTDDDVSSDVASPAVALRLARRLVAEEGGPEKTSASARDAVAALSNMTSDDRGEILDAWRRVAQACWAVLHDAKRHWSDAPVDARRLYEIAALARARLLDDDAEQALECLDLGLMLGDGTYRKALLKAVDAVEARLEPSVGDERQKREDVLGPSSSEEEEEERHRERKRPRRMVSCARENEQPQTTDSPSPPQTKLRVPSGSETLAVLERPSVLAFRDAHFSPRVPALVRGVVDKWPAYVKWRDVAYLKRVAGRRVVPVEFGENYLADDFDERLVKVEDFVDGYLLGKKGSTAYLAQHALFDQIPRLRADLMIPDYCALSDDDQDDALCPPRLNAWLGPPGTTSPLHRDRYHNLLCQVVGSKYVRLYDPAYSHLLYARPPNREKTDPHAGVSSQVVDIDAALQDDETKSFPRFKDAPYRDCVLEAGEMLYIPPGWWHYIEARELSFSVSCWWT